MNVMHREEKYALPHAANQKANQPPVPKREGATSGCMIDDK